jgi:hypothetical protein
MLYVDKKYDRYAIYKQEYDSYAIYRQVASYLINIFHVIFIYSHEILNSIRFML